MIFSEQKHELNLKLEFQRDLRSKWLVRQNTNFMCKDLINKHICLNAIIVAYLT